MTDTDSHCTETALATGCGAGEDKALRRYLSDQVALLALPAMWAGREAPYIVGSLLDVLLSLLRLDVAYVRFDDPASEEAIEGWRPQAPALPPALACTLEAGLSPDGTVTTVAVSNRQGSRSLRLIGRSPGPMGTGGLVVVGSYRADFPTERESFLLGVAIDQAATAIGTARLIARERAARAEAQEAIRTRDKFIATVSHDLKNPLTTLKGRTQMLLRRAARDPAMAPNVTSLNAIEAQADAILRLINQLLDASRLQMGQDLPLERDDVDLEKLVRWLVEQQRSINGQHTFRIETTGYDTLVGYWDAGRLEQVIGNLLSNAIKFSPEGGIITVTLSTEHEENAASSWAVLSVQDEGIGIPAADLPHTFDRFHRAGNAGEIEGNGIGLAGARHIVEQHGGTISVASQQDVGSTFTVRLPLAPIDEQ